MEPGRQAGRMKRKGTLAWWWGGLGGWRAGKGVWPECGSLIWWYTDFFFNHPITIQFSMGPLKYTPDVTELVQSML